MARCVRNFLISFFIFFLFTACRHAEQSDSISIVWKNDKAIGLSIPKSRLSETNQLEERLIVQLVIPVEKAAVLGTFRTDGEHVLFEPLVPLTRGLRYDVLFDNTLLTQIDIPNTEASAPELLEVYPTQDTLPENLLKIYLQFSQPMAEGRSLTHVALLKDDLDTMKGTFLDLQPELWNTDGTVLTLWLDPGRVKRDLIPNKKLGAPLKAGERYTLHVWNDWKSKDGKAMTAAYKKTFTTSLRDDESPAPDQWRIKIPASGSNEPFVIDLLRPLDYSLLNDAIHLLDKDRVLVDGVVHLDNEERAFRFIPSQKWKAGDFTLIIEGRLEDLAGNNLNRPFDRDLMKGKPLEEKKVFERKFTIR